MKEQESDSTEKKITIVEESNLQLDKDGALLSTVDKVKAVDPNLTVETIQPEEISKELMDKALTTAEVDRIARMDYESFLKRRRASVSHTAEHGSLPRKVYKKVKAKKKMQKDSRRKNRKK